MRTKQANDGMNFGRGLTHFFFRFNLFQPVSTCFNLFQPVSTLKTGCESGPFKWVLAPENLEENRILSSGDSSFSLLT